MEKICLGTWQFEKTSDYEAAEIIDAAHEIGINKFDTAYVYANGRAERLLGNLCIADDVIITKVPAQSKTELKFADAYPKDYVTQQLGTSIDRLQRVPSIVLLHNWHPEWEGSTQDQMLNIRDIAITMGVKNFGVSLPNRYAGEIEESEEYEMIDAIEAPFNTTTLALTAKRMQEMSRGVVVYARSLMQHGKDTDDIPQKINNALNTGANIVIGASRAEQVRQWKKWI